MPKRTSENLIKTYIWYKDLIYDESVSMGLYIGGPNEQDYPNRLFENDNKNVFGYEQ